VEKLATVDEKPVFKALKINKWLRKAVSEKRTYFIKKQIALFFERITRIFAQIFRAE